MSFQQSNYNNNNGSSNNNNGGEKKRSNFGIGRVYGKNGIIDVSVWKSDKGGCYCIINMKSAIGKDPSTGANVYEQKMANELPSIFLQSEYAKSILMAVKGKDPSTLNVNIDTHRGAKFSIVGSPSEVNVTINHNKLGDRSVTLEAISVGNASVHANFENFISYIEMGYKKCMTNKLDPTEFAMVANDDTDSQEVPF